MKRPTGRALRAPLAGSLAFVSVFVIVLIFNFSNLAEIENAKSSNPPDLKNSPFVDFDS